MKNENNKGKPKRISIETAAKLADGKSFPCKKCPIENYKHTSLFFERVCYGVCTDAFVRGFKKGYKYAKEKERNKTNI